MKTHPTSEHCPLCARPAALTTEWGWIDDDTCTAVLCCADCRTITGYQDDAVHMVHGVDEDDALSRIDPAEWRRVFEAQMEALGQDCERGERRITIIETK